MKTKIIVFLFAASMTIFLNNAYASPDAVHSYTCRTGATSTAMNAPTEPGMAHWKKERALYLHDLQLSALEQKQDHLSKTEFDKGKDLIDADLYLAYAEADQLMLDNTKTTRADLTKVQNDLNKARDLATTAEKAKIETINITIVGKHESDIACIRAPEQVLKSYEMLHKNIRSLEQQIG